jgi:hypothetical protein
MKTCLSDQISYRLIAFVSALIYLKLSNSLELIIYLNIFHILAFSVYLSIYYHLFIISGPAAQRGLGLLVSRGFLITHNNAPQSVGLLWTSDQFVAETST